MINSLSIKEREESIVYLKQGVIPAGEIVTWAGIMQSFNETVTIVFIDLEPSLNWTHKARYLIINNEYNILETFEVDQPPFLIKVPSDLHLIHIGCKAPEWAVVTSQID